MSNFICEKCDTVLIDSESGYITECEHYPIYKKDKPIEKKALLDLDNAKIFDLIKKG